jgi:hypothetical protein
VFAEPPNSWSSDDLDNLDVSRPTTKVEEPQYNGRWKKPVSLEEYHHSRHRVHNWTDVPTAEEAEAAEIRSRELEEAYAWVVGNCRFAKQSLKDIIDSRGELFVVKRMGTSIMVKGLHADQELAEIAGVNVGDLVFEVVEGTGGRKFAQARPKKPKQQVVMHPPPEDPEDEDAAYDRATTYFNLGHGEESENASDPSTHVTWVIGPSGEVMTGSGENTHGMLWGHDYCEKAWKGRYEGDTGKLSIVSPRKFQTNVPSWLIAKLASGVSELSTCRPSLLSASA